MNTVKNVEKAGRQVWLAGLGACLVGKEYAVKKFDELFEGTNSLIGAVVSKGQEVEGELKGKFSTGFPQDEKIAELREKLGLNKESKQDKITRLVSKVDALTEIVATISVKAEEEKAAAAAAKKAEAAKKAAETRKANAAAKEAEAAKSEVTEAAAPAPKPAAKRATTRKPRAAAAKPAASATAAKKPATRRATTSKTPTSAPSKTDKE